MLMKRLSFLMILMSITVSLNDDCIPNGDWDEPNLEEQVKFASVIFKGKVVGFVGPYGHYKAVRVIVSEYIRGCGPEMVIVNGFDNKDSCLPNPPKAKRQIVFFACNDEGENEFKLNYYTHGTGFYEVGFDKKKLKGLGKLTENDMRCRFGQKLFSTCKKREDAFINDYADKETITVHTKKPKVNVVPKPQDPELNRLYYEYDQHYREKYPQYFNNPSTVELNKDNLNPFNFIGKNPFGR